MAVFGESQKEGLMGVRYDFVNISINGRNMGIYAIEEYISKEFISKPIIAEEGIICCFLGRRINVV